MKTVTITLVWTWLLLGTWTRAEPAETKVCRFGIFTPGEDVYHWIMYGEHMTNQIIRIQRGYPTDAFGQGKDPRPDPRLKKVLQELGKLKE